MNKADYDNLVQKLTEQLRGQLDPARAAFQSSLGGAPNTADTINRLIDVKVAFAVSNLSQGIQAMQNAVTHDEPPSVVWSKVLGF